MGTNAREHGEVSGEIARRLRMEAASQRLSLRSLARKAEMPYPTVRKSLAGERAIDIEELFKLCHGLGVSASSILLATEQESPPPGHGRTRARALGVPLAALVLGSLGFLASVVDGASGITAM